MGRCSKRVVKGGFHVVSLGAREDEPREFRKWKW